MVKAERFMSYQEKTKQKCCPDNKQTSYLWYYLISKQGKL